MIIDNRELALKIGFTATDWHEPIDYETYKEITTDWDVKVIIKGNTAIGALYSKNGEIHVSILPEWRKRWLTKGLLKKILADMQFTRVTPGHEYMYSILNRLGYVLQPDGTVAREI